MFHGCESLNELNLNYFKTNNMINTSNMRYGYKSLKKLNLNSFKTNMSYIFF